MVCIESMLSDNKRINLFRCRFMVDDTSWDYLSTLHYRERIEYSFCVEILCNQGTKQKYHISIHCE